MTSPVLTRRDRADAAVLALLLTLVGFVLAPLAHTFTHAHGHEHSHGAPGKAHAGSSLEHFTLTSLDPAPATALDVARVSHRLAIPEHTSAPHLEARHRSEQAQGPPTHA
jgi:hypothetical protein